MTESARKLMMMFRYRGLIIFGNEKSWLFSKLLRMEICPCALGKHHEDAWGSGVKTELILNLGTRWK
jgi:hypothetical protein